MSVCPCMALCCCSCWVVTRCSIAAVLQWLQPHVALYLQPQPTAVVIAATVNSTHCHMTRMTLPWLSVSAAHRASWVATHSSTRYSPINFPSPHTNAINCSTQRQAVIQGHVLHHLRDINSTAHASAWLAAYSLAFTLSWSIPSLY